MTTIRHTAIRFLVLLWTVFIAVGPAHLFGQNSSTIRAAAFVLHGRANLEVEEQALFERLFSAALTEPAVTEALLKFEEARRKHKINQRKFPDDRDDQVATDYLRAKEGLTTVLRKAMASKDPDAAKDLFNSLRDGQTTGESPVAPIDDVPGLPRILLIGDSISIGYTLDVRRLLNEKANVHRIPVNGGATEVGLANIESWLGEGEWDVIHFNFGLHDAKYISATNMRATREAYLENLRQLVDRMEKTGARLIFATTTPVPEMLQHGKGTGTRLFDSIPQRNALAVTLMEQKGVAINDLWSVVSDSEVEIARDHDVHFSPEGYAILARAVAKSITRSLSSRPK